MNEKQMQALIKKMEKATKQSGKPARWVDPTLKATDADEGANLEDAKEIFKEMKKREF